MKIYNTALIAISCFAFAAAPCVFAQTAKKPAAAAEKTADAKENKEEDAPKGQTVDENSVLGRMAKTMQGYFAAKSPKEKLTFVLEPEKTEPMMRDFYFRESLIPGTLQEMSTPEAVAVDGMSYWRSNFALADGRTGTVFMRVVDDTPKVDWPSEVRYSAVNWDEWLEKKEGKAADFRVLAKLDTYYPKDFSDRSKYVCIKVSNGESASSVFAYLNIGDADQLEFAQMLANGQAKDCILTLKLVPGHDKIPVATVEKVVSPSWLVSKGGL